MTLLLPCKPHWNPYIPAFAEQFAGPRISCSHYIIGWVSVSVSGKWETCLSSGGCTVLESTCHWLQLCPFYKGK